MHEKLAKFPSDYFYKGELLSGVCKSDRVLPISKFQWPQKNGNTGEISPVVFIPCGELETSGNSKANWGQVSLVLDLIRKLRAVSNPISSKSEQLSICILTPYSLQLCILQNKIRDEGLQVEVETIDGFQGRESDIIIFSTVRCNDAGNVGFLSDIRRMNVGLTRAKFGLIVIGCEKTLSRTRMWKSWLDQCEKVNM